MHLAMVARRLNTLAMSSVSRGGSIGAEIKFCLKQNSRPAARSGRMKTRQKDRTGVPGSVVKCST